MNKFLILVLILKCLIIPIETRSQVNNNRISSVLCFPVNPDQTYSFLQGTTGSWTNATGCSSVTGIGEEVVLRFIAPCTNTFTLEFYEPHYPGEHPLAIRNSTGSCLPGGFSCLTPTNIQSSGSGWKMIYELSMIQGNTVDLLIEYDYWPGNPLPDYTYFTIITPHLSGMNLENINPDSLTITWNGLFDEVLLEYGPNGFAPGSDSMAGPSGTIIHNIVSPFTLNGLINDSSYSFYLRDRCGNIYSSNSVVARARIPKPDSLIALLSPCPNSAFSGLVYSGYYNTRPGSWLSVNCGSGCPQSSPEIIRKFTPDSSGHYIISKLSQGSSTPNFGCFYKETSLGLNEQNWNCIGSGGQNTPWSHSFGPLVAGTSYYIMVKATQDLGNCTPGGLFTTNFRVECEGTCPIISNHSIINPTTSSLTFLLRQGSTLGYFIIEYGLSGFTPGTDSLPGTGGTVFPSLGTYANYIIPGLLPGTTYDFYFRQYCNVTGTFSANSTVRTGTTIPICSVSPSAITTNKPNNEVCKGESITLTQFGGLLSYGASFKWYGDACGTILIGTGNSITVTPDSSQYYFVRPEDTCSTLPCTQVYIIVNELPQVWLSNPPLNQICTGDTVILQATLDSSWMYTWWNNGANLNTTTLNSYFATNAGIYSVSVNDTNNCLGSSQFSEVDIICFPPQDPVERINMIATEPEIAIKITPNPSSGIFKIFLSNTLREGQIQVFNSFAEKVWENYFLNDRNDFIIDLSNQRAGIYLVKIMRETNYSYETLILIK